MANCCNAIHHRVFAVIHISRMIPSTDPFSCRYSLCHELLCNNLCRNKSEFIERKRGREEGEKEDGGTSAMKEKVQENERAMRKKK